MSALRKYVQDQQVRTCQLLGILEALEVVHNEGTAKSGETTLIDLAVKLAAEINLGLDSVSLPAD